MRILSKAECYRGCLQLMSPPSNRYLGRGEGRVSYGTVPRDHPSTPTSQKHRVQELHRLYTSTGYLLATCDISLPAQYQRDRKRRKKTTENSINPAFISESTGDSVCHSHRKGKQATENTHNDKIQKQLKPDILICI